MVLREPRPGVGELIYDWSEPGRSASGAHSAIAVVDETLAMAELSRGPSQVLPFLGHLRAVRASKVVLGRIGAEDRSLAAVTEILLAVPNDDLRLAVSCESPTHEADLYAAHELTQRSGRAIEVVLSILVRQVGDSGPDVTASFLGIARGYGLRVTCLLCDATSCPPSSLSPLVGAALDHGAVSVCVGDVDGTAIPDGVRCLIHHVRGVAKDGGHAPSVGFRASNLRGLALENALTAVAHGDASVWAAALGGRVGESRLPAELVLLHRALSIECTAFEGRAIVDYCHAAAVLLGIGIPPNHPFVGRDAFRTATGVHAAAIHKALAMGDRELADLLYSSVPAALLGREQTICIGHMSGSSNVEECLARRGVLATDELVSAILRVAKAGAQVLTEDELDAVLREHGVENRPTIGREVD